MGNSHDRRRLRRQQGSLMPEQPKTPTPISVPVQVQTTIPPEPIRKEHHGREYLVAFLSIIGEYAAVRYGEVWLAWLAAIFLWLAVVSYTRKLFRQNRLLRYGGPIFAAIVIISITHFLTLSPKTAPVASPAPTPPAAQSTPVTPATSQASQSIAKGKAKDKPCPTIIGAESSKGLVLEDVTIETPCGKVVDGTSSEDMHLKNV